ncbi:MAG TPA: hypothetical protein VKQ72_19415 [Aggregatilineales bacterium]|nr:hypothetical protein [Aggregatilineales bacterium]
MSDTFDLIMRLSNERQELYRTAAQEHLNSDQRKSLEELNARIPLAWDQYRRELATERNESERSRAKRDSRHNRGNSRSSRYVA